MTNAWYFGGCALWLGSAALGAVCLSIASDGGGTSSASTAGALFMFFSFIGCMVCCAATPRRAAAAARPPVGYGPVINLTNIQQAPAYAPFPYPPVLYVVPHAASPVAAHNSIARSPPLGAPEPPPYADAAPKGRATPV